MHAGELRSRDKKRGCAIGDDAVRAMSHEKQEADFTAEVDTLLPQLEKLADVCIYHSHKAGSLQDALDLIASLEKRTRGVRFTYSHSLRTSLARHVCS